MRVCSKDLKALLAEDVGTTWGGMKLVWKSRERKTSPLGGCTTEQECVVEREGRHGRVFVTRTAGVDMIHPSSADSWGETVELEDVELVVMVWAPKDAA